YTKFLEIVYDLISIRHLLYLNPMIWLFHHVTRGTRYLRYEGLQYTDADIADFSEAKSARQIPDKGDLRDYWIGISSAGDFLGTASSYTSIRDPILSLCHRLIACSIAGRSQAPEKAWVASRPERQPDATAGAPGDAKDGPVADEDAPAIPTSIQAPQPPPPLVAARIKPASKFRTTVHQYVTDTSRLSTPKSRMEKKE
nr:hypothetical protein [Tanacetum cinerariifolium]